MFHVFDIAAFTIERMWQNRMLVVWVLVGLIVACTLALSLPLYVDSVYSDLLTSRLATPAYAFKFRYLGQWNGNIGEDDVRSADGVIRQRFTSIIGEPVVKDVRYTRVGIWNTSLEDGTRFGAFNVGLLEGGEDQRTIINGTWPPEQATEIDADTIPLLVPEAMFYKYGLQIGDTLRLQVSGADTQTAEVTAIWRAANLQDPAWIFPPKFFDEVLLVRSEDAWKMVEGIEKPVDETAWYVVFEDSGIRTADVPGLLAGITNGLREVGLVLPGIRPETPESGLNAFSAEVNQLTLQLFIIIAPVGGLVLYFVTMVAGLLVSRQQAEDVKLRSRGMSRCGVLVVHFLMWFGLIGAALAIAVGVSPLVVQLVGRATSFLRFDAPGEPLQVTLTSQALLVSAVTGLIAGSSGLWLAWRSTAQNINSFRQAAARSNRAWWQRTYLDLLLLGMGLYVLFTLTNQDGLVTSVDSPFSDPLTFAGPTVFALGLTLLFLRLWPFLLSVGGRGISYSGSISMLMALRELTRSIGRYRGTLLMMSFTLSLTGFTASMASTLDRSLRDTIDYRTGADLVLVTAIDAQTEDEQNTETGETTTTVTGFNAPAVQDLANIEAIENISRVGNYSARLLVGGRNRVDGLVVGVDRWSLAAITPFRQDYASEPLATLLNKLATARSGILLSRQTMIDNNLAIGQELQLEVQALNQWYPMTVRVMDVLDYFPTINPAEHNFFAIMNLDPIFETVGTSLPFNVWLGLKPGADTDAVAQAVREARFPVVRWLDPVEAINTARAEPGRRGVLGFLSIGFMASIMLTLIATVIQNAASFRAQSMQLGALQAMGLSGSAVGRYMIFLQGLSAGGSILSGTLIGGATTVLFLPLLDFSGGLPPYLVRIAWDEIGLVYAMFAGAFLIVVAIVTLTLGRQRIATIVRLGEM